MRYKILPLLLATVTAGCGMQAGAATRSFPVGGFDRISTSVPFDVHVHTGTAPAVRAEGPQEALDRLQVTVRGGELVISSEPGGRWFSGWNSRREKMVIDVNVPMVTGATLSGPGDLAIDRVRTPRFGAALSGPGDLGIGTIETDQLNLTLDGPGDITLAGRAGTSNMVLRGPGDIHGANLTSRNAVLMLSGPGDIVTTVTGAVQGTLSGPGDITIHGGARCDITKHGPGDVRCS